jgi:hypothetical protein
MKLKLIAAAAALALSGAANAAIDNGNTGNGELFFTAWDGVTSYTFDLNTTINAFESAVAAGSGAYVSVTLDALFGSFIAGANLPNLVWNVVAGDNSGARRILSTFSTLPGSTIGGPEARSTAGAVASFAQAVNVGIAAQGNGNSAVFAAGSAGYADNTTGVRFGNNIATGLNFSNGGSIANNSYAAGLGFMRIDALQGGTAPSVYNPYADVRAYFDYTTGTLTIAAVPEPETYAMLLAGLGLMGAIARRRRKQG